MEHQGFRHRLMRRSREAGATVIEYVLVASCIALLAVAGFSLIGKDVTSKVDAVNSGFTSS